jgi:hypothetical protein
VHSSVLCSTNIPHGYRVCIGSRTLVQSIEIAGRFFVGSTPSNGRVRLPFALDGRDRIREAIEAEWPRRGNADRCGARERGDAGSGGRPEADPTISRAVHHSANVAGGAFLCTAMDDNGVAQIANSDGDIVMKIIVSAVIALSVLAGIAAPASAFDAKGFYGQLERESGGSSQ